MNAQITLVASLLSFLPLAFTAFAGEHQSGGPDLFAQQEPAALDPFLADFIVSQLDAGGWGCQCRLVAESHKIQKDFNLDIIMDGEGHVFKVKNDSTEEIRVLLSFSDKENGHHLGQLEVTVPPFTTRKAAMYYAFEDKSSVHEIVTQAEVYIPEPAVTMFPDSPFVRVYRHHDYVQAEFDDRETGSLHCTQTQCSLRDEGGIGGCHGPSFSDC